MYTETIVQGSDASDENGGLVPDAPGFEGFWYTGGALMADAQRNLLSVLDGGVGDAAPTGTTPTLQPTFITIPPAVRSALRTPVFEGLDWTAYFVARANNAVWNVTTFQHYIGGNLNTTGASGTGAAIFFQGNNGVANALLRVTTMHVSGATTASQNTNLPVGALANSWQVYGVRVESGVGIRVRNLSSGDAVDQAKVDDYAPGDVRPWDIGAPPNVTSLVAYGATDIAMQGIVPNTAHSDEQMDVMLLQIRYRMAMLGISV